MRKLSKIKDKIEYYSTVRTQNAILNCNVALVLIDAEKGFGKQDKTIVDQVISKGKALIFIVNKLDIHYKKPVLLDQLIKIESSLSELKKASFSFNQRVVINSEIMCEANVLCGCVDLKTKKPTALPEDLRKRMLDKKNAS